MVKIALLGGTGGCGSAFLQYALDAGHTIVMLARSPSKVTTTHQNLIVVEGDGTNAKDVSLLCSDGVDVLVSCAGSARIMESLATNCVAACKEHNIDRCYFITSLGMGGSSPTIRFILGCIVSFGNINDCEKADKIILDAGFTAIRPTELTDKGEPLGKYNATSDTGMSLAGAVHKSDVGKFICDELDKNEWAGKPVQVYKARI